MIYVVSGFMRCGTSMMMQCLEAGGLEPAFAPERDRLNDRFGDEDYEPNPGGFYELNRREYQEYGFPRKYDGKLIKCLWGGVWRFVVLDYKVVFLLRDPEEIRQSCESFFGQPAPPALKNYDEQMQDTIDMLHNRKDTDVTVLHYRDVIQKPLETFQSLREGGWPIDAEQAAAVVDGDLYRFRIEKLTVGI